MPKPELGIGQIAWGNPTGEFGVPEFAEACIRYVMSEYARVWWNKNQTSFSESYGHPEGEGDLDVPGLDIRPYYWGDDEAESERPNLAYDGVEIRWYKYIGRGMTCNVEWDANHWAEWMAKVLSAIRKAEKPL